MKENNYLSSYLFNWDAFDIVLEGKSSLDTNNYLRVFNDKDGAKDFLQGYGFDLSNPVEAAELFGIYQESIQFIKRFFLKDSDPDGLDLEVPVIFFSITDVSELLIILSGKESTKVESLWASIILKVMHTILHTDKDLRYSYFSSIQTQIFDRFYKYLSRDKDNNLFLRSSRYNIPLIEFETKAKKTRESVIIKLLHKKENVAEELFDRIGVRFVAKTKLDCLRIVKFLQDENILIPNNIKPSRSHNSLVDLEKLRKNYKSLIKSSIKNKVDEKVFQREVEALIEDCEKDITNENNKHTRSTYKAIHFTGRQLIKYKNPFLKKFNEVKRLAKQQEESELAKAILKLDASSLSRDIRFFYPYEVQITDNESHMVNTEGEASHEDYKKSQLMAARERLFKDLLNFLS